MQKMALLNQIHDFIEQKTVFNDVTFHGKGVHLNKLATIVIKPSLKPGIFFQRIDIPGSLPIPAHFRFVKNTNFSTYLEKDHVSIQTIEHVLAALEGCGVTNAIIEVDGSEIPILDGSAIVFYNELIKSPLRSLNQSYPIYHLAEQIIVETSYGHIKAWPTPHSYASFHMTINAKNRFGDKLGHQSLSYSMDQDFKNIAMARTFGCYEEGLLMQQKGLALGASLDNTLVIKDHDILNPSGMRIDNEMARHKILDAIGDFSLFPQKIIAHFDIYNGGHTLNHLFLQKLDSLKISKDI